MGCPLKQCRGRWNRRLTTLDFRATLTWPAALINRQACKSASSVLNIVITIRKTFSIRRALTSPRITIPLTTTRITSGPVRLNNRIKNEVTKILTNIYPHPMTEG